MGEGGRILHKIIVYYIYWLFAHWAVNVQRHQEKEQMVGGGGMALHCTHQVNPIIESYEWITTSGSPLFLYP